MIVLLVIREPGAPNMTRTIQDEGDLPKDSRKIRTYSTIGRVQNLVSCNKAVAGRETLA